MFLNTIKRYILKKKLKNNLCNVKPESLNSPIIRIGLIVDESYFLETAALKQEIISNGIDENNITVVVYRDNIKKKNIYSESTFGLKDLNFKGEFSELFIKDFVSEEFDLLINYYNVEKPILLLLTHSSKAKFKVGFSTVDKRLNHF